MQISRCINSLARAGILLLSIFLATSAIGNDDRYRVLVSTDIGGTDPDDFQSMVHFLLYTDVFDVEGIVSSPFGDGRVKHIHEVIDAYEKDFPNLVTHSKQYPTADYLRSVTKQGELLEAPLAGVRQATEGSRWIIERARAEDARPLYLLVWGGLEDLAQALHDAPDILPKLRVHFIGGPNKKWSVNAYNYIEQQHPTLWMIESNSTYRGWFVGGDQSGNWGNDTFVNNHIAGHGALGQYFATHLGGVIKMGDSPTVTWLLHGTPEDPTKPSWGGQFMRIWDDRKTVFTELTVARDQAEAFGVTEFALPIPKGFSKQHTAKMIFDNSDPASIGEIDGDVLRFRFSPRDVKVWPYIIKSDFAALDGKTGVYNALAPSKEKFGKASTSHPNWWIDDQHPATAEGEHAGAKTVSQWRHAIFEDFAARMDRAQKPLTTDKN